MIKEEKVKNWYTIKVQNNREKSVSQKLKTEMLVEFGEEINFIVPTKTYSTIKDGKRNQVEKILYPGYVFVETSNVDKISHLVKITNGATALLKDSKGMPTILRKSEVDRMFDDREVELSNAKSPDFSIHEKVEIMNGPFATFKGVVNQIDKDKVKVEVVIFGRSTMVDLLVTDILKSDD
jgi:transcriptional antiterminator NusG